MKSLIALLHALLCFYAPGQEPEDNGVDYAYLNGFTETERALEFPVLHNKLPIWRPRYEVSWEKMATVEMGSGDKLIGGIREGKLDLWYDAPLYKQLILGYQFAGGETQLVDDVPGLQRALEKLKSNSVELDKGTVAILSKALTEHLWTRCLADDFEEKFEDLGDGKFSLTYSEIVKADGEIRREPEYEAFLRVDYDCGVLSSIILKPRKQMLGPTGYCKDYEAIRLWWDRKFPLASKVRDREGNSIAAGYIQKREQWWMSSVYPHLFEWWNAGHSHEAELAMEIGPMVLFELYQQESETERGGTVRGLCYNPGSQVIFYRLLRSMVLLSAAGARIEEPILNDEKLKLALLGSREEKAALEWSAKWAQKRKEESGFLVSEFRFNGEFDLLEWGYPEKVSILQNEWGFHSLRLEY